MKASGGTIHIGTSGWSYDHWTGPFYPPDLTAGERLAFYARHFDTVEINSSFYRLPSPKTIRNWCDSVPDGFRFALKASRYITHVKKLKDPNTGLGTLFECASMLGDRAGPILFQLPPRWHFNDRRLADFVGALSADFHYAFEFRDHSWINPRTRTLLAENGIAFCIYDLDGFQSPKSVTADFAYVRLHGPAGPYQGSYDTDTLNGWAGVLSAWSGQGRDSYCYFDNDQAGHAAANALRLRQMLVNR